MSRFESHQDHPKIRTFEPADAVRFAALEHDVWHADPLLTPEEADARIARLAAAPASNPDFNTNLVATLDDEIIGTLGYYIDTVPLYKDPDIEAALEHLTSAPPSLGKTATFGHIYELSVHPGHRGEGHAKRLALAGLTAIRRGGVSMHKFHLNERTKQQIVTPATMREFGVVEVRHGIRGHDSQHPELIRTLYMGTTDSSIEALQARIDNQ